MTITGNVLADFGLQDRKTALLCWAERWDDITDQLTAGSHSIIGPDADASLLAAVRPLTHPLLDADTVSDLFHTLRVSVGHKVTFEIDGLAALPDEFSDLFPGSAYDVDVIDQILDSNINLALWPLLSGLDQSCVECQRTKVDVLDWNPPIHGLRCNSHRLVSV